ncbi:hypothetical protein AQUCO_03500151v1 [Aquilegia coerulea]|uniref:FAR1 domain-containing protein n=1 Tax=Aquilegia coerulea TaxID=218851 RepID=A0A2G5CWD9_AQUCA|nr:hypothetical protein AQUCO_03500151v1 [Aquilegia coerulea]PIA35586.1 hypothetical protein AQUCO_03500151v1 [Aquilegia coerulea]PIA35587.1 hypothetical protein AQUCO_03500151v1 [Aquilegia coerulea]PIA35588.1 hypothetical protein AQUCO_03500151v1 [Aquilegia coerulea]
MAEEMDIYGGMFEIENIGEVEKDEVADDNIPVELNEINEPGVGMIFSSFHEAKSFYDIYAQSKGFSIRTRSTYRDRRGPDLSSALFVCTCEGFNQRMPKSDDEGKIRRTTSIVRSGCKASMRVTNIRGTTAWKVTVFSDQHNHEFIPQNKGDLVKCNKRKSRAAKTPTEAMRSCDVYRQATRLAHMAGRSEEIYEVIMAVMEETFKKVSQMEKELFNPENDKRCLDNGYDNSNNLGNSDQLIPAEPHISRTNLKKRDRKGKEMENNINILDTGLTKWQPLNHEEDISVVS